MHYKNDRQVIILKNFHQNFIYLQLHKYRRAGPGGMLSPSSTKMTLSGGKSLFTVHFLTVMLILFKNLEAVNQFFFYKFNVRERHKKIYYQDRGCIIVLCLFVSRSIILRR